MSSINFTENQFKVIDYGKENLLVSASAGSGKTTTMIERIIKIICEKGASIKNMLVSTFTNAAADAISEKLVDALRLKIHTLKKEIKVDKIEIERLEREIECLPNAAIGTLHSWCQSIIRKYFYETNDDPGFGIVEPTEYNLWIINAVNDVLEDELEIKNDKFMNVYKYFVYKRRNTRLSTAIIEIIYFLENVIDPFGYLDKALDCYDDTKYKDEYDTQIIDLETKITDDFIKLKSELDNNDVELKYSNKLIYQLEYYFANGVKEGTFVQKNHLNGCEDIKDKIAGNIKEYWELKNNTFDNEKCKCVAEVLCDLAKKALKKIIEKKEEKGILTFSDLEHKTLSILNSPSAEDVINSYEYIFIDEYQDINPVQNAIIAKLDRNNLFFVGDVKQSIYGFRGCIATAFSEKRKEYVKKGQVIDLNDNFRSASGILDFCNKVFSNVMTEEFGGQDYAKDGKFTINSSVDKSSVEIIVYNKDQVESNKWKSSNNDNDYDIVYSVKKNALCDELEKHNLEAERLVERVNKFVRVEQVRFEDIVILVRSRKQSVTQLRNALVREGYPVSIDGKVFLTDNQCVRDLLSYLKIVNNFKDDISLLGAMHSFYGNFSYAEIAKVRQKFKSKKLFLWDAVINYAEKETDELSKKINGFIEEANKYSRLSKTLSVSELVGRITAEKKVFTYSLIGNDGLNNSGFLGYLMDYTEKFTGQLSEFIESLEDTSPEINGISANGTIKIESIHASKGLEYPIVMLFGINDKFNSMDYNEGNHIIPMSDIGIAVDISSDDEKIKSYPLEIAKKRKKQASIAEELRLLYVAMTRAKKKLVFFLEEKDLKDDKKNSDSKMNSWAKWISPFVNKGYDENDSLKREYDEFKPISNKSFDECVCIKKSTMEEFNDIREVIEKEIPAGKEIKRSVTKLLKEMPFDEENGPFEPLTPAEYESTDALTRGTAYHKALEIFDYSQPFEIQLASLEKNVPNFSLVDIQKLKVATEKISIEIGDRKIYREKDFIFPIKGNKEVDNGTLIQGVIDLLVVGDTNEIIDYKTGVLNDERRAKYLKQLSLYKEAVETIAKIKIDKTRIYLIDKECFMND